jgi:hypothetical protein
MTPHRLGAALAVLVLCAGARASADPAVAAAPTGETKGETQTSLENEVRAAKATADQAIASMDSTAWRVRRLLRKARANGVRAEIACVDDGLSRADVALRVARDEWRNALDAFTRGDMDGARRSMLRLERAREGSRAAATSADGCFVDQAASSVTGTQVRLILETRLPPES